MKIFRKTLFWSMVFLWGTVLWAQTPAPESTPQPFEPSPAVKKQVAPLFILMDQAGKAIQASKLKHKHRENAHDNFGADKDLYFGSNGKVREYDTSYGSDDSMVSFSYIYDDQGRLRVVLTHAGYVYRNRSDDQTIFLDEKGKVLEVIHETQEGADEETEGELGKAHKTKEILAEPLREDVEGDLKMNPLKDFKADFGI